MAAVIPVVTKLSPRIIRVLGCNPGSLTLQGTNTYIIGTGKRRILLDVGEGDIPEYINHLKSILINEGFTFSHIFLSHWHQDHSGGLEDILNLKEFTPYCQVWKYPCKGNEDQELFKQANINLFKDGQEFSIEGATIRIAHTPGHATDHVSFFLVEDNAIFSGDCVLGEGTAIFEDLDDYMDSLKVILNLKPSIVYPGHGNVIHHPQEKIQYYIQHRYEREHQILEKLQENPSQLFNEMDLVKMIYKDLPERMVRAAEANVNHHLIQLLKNKKVMQVQDMWKHKDAYNTILSVS